MALSDPQPLGQFHGALQPRGAYLSGPDLVYAVWSVRETGGIRFAAGPHRGAEGTISVLSGDRILDGETFVLTHEDPSTHVVTLITFEFDNNGSVVETNELRAVDFVGTETADEMRDLIIDAINLAPNPDLVASSGGPGIVSLLHNVPGRLGAYPITDTVSDPYFTHTGMTWPGIILPVDADTVRSFGVAALTGDRMAVVYDNGDVLKFFVYDFVAGALITDTTVLSQGGDPAMVNDGSLRTTLIDDNVLKMITELSGDAIELVASPTYILRQHDVGRKQPYVVKYLGVQSQSVDVALPVRADANSVFVHDFRNDPVALPAFVPQSVGLDAYFKLNDNAPDINVVEATGSGVSNGALYGGKNTEDVAAGGGFILDGAVDYVQIPDDGVLLRPDYVSLCARVNINVHNNFANVIMKPYRTAGWSDPYLSYGLRTDHNGSHKAVMLATVGSTDYYIESTTVLAPGTPYLLIGTYDGHFLRIYVNGVLENSLAAEGVLGYSGDYTPLILGMRSPSSPGEWYNGFVDEVRVYGYAITQDVIDDIVAATPLEAPPPYPEGLWDYYFADKSGNGNDVKFLESDVYHTPGVGLRFGRDPYAGIYDWDVPASFITLESLFVPSGEESRGRMLDGQLFLGYDAWNRLYFGYVDGGTVHTYRQSALAGVVNKRLNHVAVTHQWGVAASTKLYVNGLLVPGSWVSGTGATDPALGTITSSVDMGTGDYLVQLSASNVAKSQADIEDYAKGRL